MTPIAPPRGTPRRLLPASVAGLIAMLLLSVPLAWAAKAKTRSRSVNASGELLRTAKPGPLATVQAGTLRGTPFGSGRMVLKSKLKQATVTSTFTLTTRFGRVNGKATARLTLDGDTANYKGTASITSGTRRYRRAKAVNLRFTGTGPVSGKRTEIALSGRVRY